MNSVLINKLNRILALEPSAKNESALRNNLNSILLNLYTSERDDSDVELMASQCKKKLRILQNNVICENRKQEDFFICELTETVENLCSACDLFLINHNRRLVFDIPDNDILIKAAPETLSWLIINMVSNACIHTDDNIISVTVDERACGAAVTVSSSGSIYFNGLNERMNTKGSGTAAMLSAAHLHSASLLFANIGGTARSAVYLKKGNLDNLDYSIPPDFAELLSDKLSIIHTGLSEVN